MLVTFGPFLLLAGLSGLPRVAAGDAIVLERTPSSVRMAWSETAPNGRPADRTILLALPPGAAPDVRVVAVDAEAAPAVAVPAPDGCERRQRAFLRGMDRDLSPELFLPGVLADCATPDRPLSPNAVRVMPAIRTPSATLLPLRIEDFDSPRGRFRPRRVELHLVLASAASAEETGPPPDLSGIALPKPLDVAVSGRGRVAVPAEALSGFWSGEIPAGRLALSSREGPAAIRVRDVNGDGLLGAGDGIEFFAEAGNTRFDRRKVYRLSIEEPESPAIQRMAEVQSPAGPGTTTPLLTRRRMEERLRYVINVRNGEKDNFYWSFASAPNGWSIPFDLPGSPAAAPAAQAAVVLQGLSTHVTVDPDHHVAVSVNGVPVGEVFFDGTAEVTATFTVPAGVLVADGNILDLSMPGDTGASSDIVLVDRFSVAYERALAPASGESAFEFEAAPNAAFEIGPFPAPDTAIVLDVTDPRNPRVQEAALASDGQGGWRGLAGGFGGNAPRALHLSTATGGPESIARAKGQGLTSRLGGADLVIVTAPEFLEAARTLGGRRESQGMRVRIVRTDEIYGAFSGGELDPSAIRSFLAFALAEWEPPSPRHVLLLGDGTFDYLHDLPGGTPFENGTFVPVALYDSSYNETVSDNYFVDFDGDLLPELSIGRIPAASVEEAELAVGKILAYEDRAFGVGFETRAMFVADNAVENWEVPYFEELPGELASILPSYMDKEMLQLSGTTAAEMSQAIVSGINQGAVWVNYIGHGSVRSWAQEQIFTTATIDSLTNTDRPTFFVTMTCSNGLFQFPNVSGTGVLQRSLAEVALLSGEGGAIAFLAPTNPSLPDPLPVLNEAAVRAAFDGSVTTLGEVTLEAKRALDPSDFGAADILRGLVLFGDPSMSLRNDRHPTARIEADAVVPTGGWVDLDGSSSSDPDGQPLTYAWTLWGAPDDSAGLIAGTGAPMARFWPDHEGTYVVALNVTDGFTNDDTWMIVEATGQPVAPPKPPVGCGCRLDAPGPLGSRGIASIPILLAAAAWSRRRWNAFRS